MTVLIPVGWAARVDPVCDDYSAEKETVDACGMDDYASGGNLSVILNC